MARYHVSGDGKPRKCTATGSCPLAQNDENGNIVNHFDSEAEAVSYAEKVAAEGRENKGSLSKNPLDAMAKHAPDDAPDDQAARAARELEERSMDPDQFVRRSVAEDPDTPPDVLARMSTDPNEYVRRNVADNPGTPADVLARMSMDSAGLVRYEVSENPNTPASVLVKMSDDPDKNVRGAVADHPNTPLNVVEKLAHDEDPLVRQWALDELEDRRRKNDQ